MPHALPSRLLAAFAFLALVACDSRRDRDADDTLAADSVVAVARDPDARATMRDESGRELGILTLTDTANGISIAGTLRNLPPGEHGFHLHMTGACTPAFEAAGGHWNPTGRKHGRDNPDGPHLGDLANITVLPDSSVRIAAVTPGGSIDGVNALLDTDGAAVMIHAGPDDYRTDPSGDAGGRLACGVVERVR
jgi:Cu-Zn family superoxide dismutase